MPTYTNYLKLVKPSQDEFYNVDAFNANSDAIDRNAKEAEAALERVRKFAEESQLAQIKTYPLKLAISGWKPLITGGFQCEVQNDAVREVHHVEIEFTPQSLDLATKSGLSSELEVLDGKLRFQSDSIPDSDLTGEYIVIAESSGLISSETELGKYAASEGDIAAMFENLN